MTVKQLKAKRKRMEMKSKMVSRKSVGKTKSKVSDDSKLVLENKKLKRDIQIIEENLKLKKKLKSLVSEEVSEDDIVYIVNDNGEKYKAGKFTDDDGDIVYVIEDRYGYIDFDGSNFDYYDYEVTEISKEEFDAPMLESFDERYPNSPKRDLLTNISEDIEYYDNDELGYDSNRFYWDDVNELTEPFLRVIDVDMIPMDGMLNKNTNEYEAYEVILNIEGDVPNIKRYNTKESEYSNMLKFFALNFYYGKNVFLGNFAGDFGYDDLTINLSDGRTYTFGGSDFIDYL